MKLAGESPRGALVADEQFLQAIPVRPRVFMKKKEIKLINLKRARKVGQVPERRWIQLRSKSQI